MLPDQQARTLFTVESAGDFIHSPHNARFLVSEELHFHRDEFASRSTTPAEGDSTTPVPEVKTKTYLRFTVDNIGDQTSFVFGSERETCDVYVYATQKISRRIFAVELENHGQDAMLKNLSTHGIGIESPIYERQRFRRKRALHPGDRLTIFLPGFNIEVQFLNHSDHKALHALYLQQLGPQLALPSINQLGLDSIPESSARSQRSNPYQLHTEIGSGNFGTVYKGVHSYTGEVVAIKVFHKREADPSKDANKGDRILESLSHPTIVRFIAFISQPRMLVMELLEHQNLEEVHGQRPLLEHDVRDLMNELLSGLEYLHSEHVTHRDLKPANIIIISREPMCIKMTDFGLATRSDMLQTFCGSHLYLAPEVDARRPYSNKVDIWSVGVIALELAAGLPDYPRARRKDWPGLLRDRMEAAPLHFSFYLFVKPLLHSDAGQRPSARECLSNRFLHVESRFVDAVGSPTEYAPTPPEYRDQYEAVPAQAPATTYLRLKYAGATVMYRSNDGLVNVTQLLKAIKHKRTVTWASLEKKIGNMHRIFVSGRTKAGSYVPISDAERILHHLGLSAASIQVLIRQIDEKS